MDSSLKILHHRRNVYSSNGEDGVLEHLLPKLPKANRWAVEFGAWDGKVASNACHLLDTGWNVVFIECDPARFKDLKQNHGANPRAKLIERYIDFEGPNSLDGIFASVEGFPQEPDFVSMDIDGCEYHLWESLLRFSPKVIMVEFNPSIPLDYNYVQPKDFKINHSSSLGAFVELGKRRGYSLISVLDYNAIFVRDDLVAAMGYSLATPEELFQPFRDRYQTRLWQSMDGRLHLIGCNRLIWHNMVINPERIQVLPRLLQQNTAGSSLTKKILKFIYYRVPFAPQIANLLISGHFHLPVPSEEKRFE